ncbi:MAG: MBL fold metallo-hydrolase [Bacteroidales bacterium]|nr:MBL fold metallo-hydrolase [Candidatus Cryptobacteroides equifaecalis]
MKAKLTFLGTGTSSGVPMLGCDCPVCTSTDPRDNRLRASAFVEYGGLSILVDCGPDFRQEALRAGITHIDGILLTHNHMDHIGGLDDTRSLNLKEKHPVNIYCEEYVEDTLRRMYSYAFAEPRYPGAPEWRVHRIDPDKPFLVYSNAGDEILEWEKGFGYRHSEAVSDVEIPDPVEVIPIHGYHLKNKGISVLGYRFGNIAYLTDMNLIEDSEIEKLKGVDAVTINCVKIGTHNSHFSLQECLDFFEKVKAKKSYITHLSHLLPKYTEFAQMLPEGVYPAYDGLVIE